MNHEQLSQFERINVVGTSGCGKSTFARQLAELLELPCYEMDQLFWKPDWQESSDEELLQKVREVTSGPRWVLDGNYTRTIAEKWKQVQLVIWLDLSFARTLFRVAQRTIRRSITQQEIWPGTGNRESLARAFLSKESVIWWAMTTHRKNRKTYGKLTSSPEYSQIRFLRLNSPNSVATCLENLRRTTQQPRAPKPVAG